MTFLEIEDPADRGRKIVLSLSEVTSFYLGKRKEDQADLLKIYLRADDDPFVIAGKDARRCFDELKIALRNAGLLGK